MDYASIIIDFADLAAIVAIGYYATMLLLHMTHGALEKGWRMVLVGALFLIFGQMALAIDSLVPAWLNIAWSDLGGLLQLIGSIFVALGFRAQHNVWKQRPRSGGRPEGKGISR